MGIFFLEMLVLFPHGCARSRQLGVSPLSLKNVAVLVDNTIVGKFVQSVFLLFEHLI
jgi:hypothetical protein